MSGQLIAFEGPDGAGKSTQAGLLTMWLGAQKVPTLLTQWKSSPDISPVIKSMKKAQSLKPIAFSLLHAADNADRQERFYGPALKEGHTVVADRYIYTAFARDTVRGLKDDWVRMVYAFARKPDLVIYLRLGAEDALKRIMATRGATKFYESGQDMGYSKNRLESFKIFQSMVINKYDSLAQEFGFKIIDADQPMKDVRDQVRDAVIDTLGVQA